ncbi:MAG TPA: cytochrome c oxidase assembly factor Coa1 family protein [Polyangiaceae bacterium]
MQYPQPGAPPYPPAPPAKPRWSNQKVLAVAGGVGCVLALLLGGFIAVIFFVVLGSIKQSDAYETSHRLCVTHPVVIADLGVPIEDGLFPSGSINTSGAGGDADLTFSLSGPKGEGSAHVVAKRSAAGWSIEQAEWTFGGKVTPLAAAPAAPSAPAP